MNNTTETTIEAQGATRREYMSGTGHSFFASVQELKFHFGPATYKNNTGREKVNFDWWLKTPEGIEFSVFDWKYYRRIKLYDIVEWNIRAYSLQDGRIASEYLQSLGIKIS